MIKHLQDNFVISSQKNYDESAIMSYFNKINLENKFIYCLNFVDIYMEKKLSKLQWIIDDIIFYKKYANNSNKKFIFVIDASGEAPTYCNDLKDEIDYIVKLTDLKLKDVLLITEAFNHNDHNIRYSICYGSLMSYKEILDTSFYDALPKFHFISLARIARFHRIVATIEIIDRGLENYGNCSLGSGYYNSPSENNLMMQTIFKKYNHKFPLCIDEQILDNTTQEIQRTLYKATNEKISHAFVNYVLETAFDYKKNKIGVPATWSSPSITEKSTKPFAWGQVPIFLNCANSLCKLREFGFDLFDDIIDHGYDYEKEPMKRIKLTVNQLEKICNWSIEDCIKFKKDNMKRFIKNRKLLENLFNSGFFEINKTNLQVAFTSYDL